MLLVLLSAIRFKSDIANKEEEAKAQEALWLMTEKSALLMNILSVGHTGVSYDI